MFGIPQFALPLICGYITRIGGGTGNDQLIHSNHNNVSLKDLLKGRNVHYAKWKLWAFTLLGLCAAISLEAVAGVTCHLLLHQTPAASTVLLDVLNLLTQQKYVGVFCYVVIMCITAPIMEELICRRLLYSWMRQRWGIGIALFGSSAVFAALHFDPNNALGLFLIGLVLAAVFEKTRSVFAAMALHSALGLWALISTMMLLVTWT